MGQRVLVLSAGIGSGHNSAAAVLEASLRADPEVAQVLKLDVLDTASELYRTVYDDGYFAMVEAVPWLVGWGYDKGDAPFRLGNSLSLWDRFNTHITVRTIKNYRPDVVICTHFIPTRLVSLLLNRGTLRAPLARRHDRLRLPGAVAQQPLHQLLRGAGRNEGPHGRHRRTGRSTDRVRDPGQAGPGRRDRQRCGTAALRPAAGRADAPHLGRCGRRALHHGDRPAEPADAQPLPGDRGLRSQRRAEERHRASGALARRPVQGAGVHQRHGRPHARVHACSSANPVDCRLRNAWPPACR